MAVAGLSALFAVMASVYYYCGMRCLRERMRRLLLERERIPREAAEEVLRIARDILDNMAISGDDPQLLARKLSKMIFSKGDEERGLVASAEKLANYCRYGIADHLRESCPALTTDEIRMSCFICMGFPNHSLQYIFGYSNTASLYNQRSRIRHKMGIAEQEITLERYLEGMVEELRKRAEKEEMF